MKAAESPPAVLQALRTADEERSRHARGPSTVPPTSLLRAASAAAPAPRGSERPARGGQRGRGEAQPISALRVRRRRGRSAPPRRAQVPPPLRHRRPPLTSVPLRRERRGGAAPYPTGRRRRPARSHRLPPATARRRPPPVRLRLPSRLPSPPAAAGPGEGDIGGAPRGRAAPAPAQGRLFPALFGHSGLEDAEHRPYL